MLTKTFGVSHILMSYITYVVHHMSPSQDKKKLSMALTVLHFYNIYTSIHNHLHESLSYNSPLALMSLYSCVTIVLAVVIDRVLTDGMSQERKNEFMNHICMDCKGMKHSLKDVLIDIETLAEKIGDKLKCKKIIK